MRELQRIFTYFNQATAKNTCQIFLPKKSRNRSFKSKKSFDNPRHLKFEVECGTKPERAGKNKEGGEGEGKEGRVSFVLSPSPTRPQAHPIAVSSAQSSLPRPHYLNAWNRLYVMEPCSPSWKT